MQGLTLKERPDSAAGNAKKRPPLRCGSHSVLLPERLTRGFPSRTLCTFGSSLRSVLQSHIHLQSPSGYPDA